MAVFTAAAPVLTAPPAAGPPANPPVVTRAVYQAAAVTIPFGTTALPSLGTSPVTVPTVMVASALATDGNIEPPGVAFGSSSINLASINSPSINLGTITPAVLSMPEAREGGIVHRGFASTVARMMTSDPLIEAGLVTMAFATVAFASRSVLLAMQRQRY